MKEDHEFWENLTEPKIPNDYEVSVYKNYIKGRTLLLGETKKLRQIVDKGLDLFPTDFAEKGDWFELKEHFDTIIGDGVLNFEYGFTLLEYIKPYCDRFVCRVFMPELKIFLQESMLKISMINFLVVQLLIKHKKVVVLLYITLNNNERIYFVCSNLD
ncbi:hypothetical protein M0Q97_03815 [Candidatus Dojkabacteria bacterium]|jgi:hypothetical protein|nr:hypothetical protein [Candidatus Dojkabacteria bacterium]